MLYDTERNGKANKDNNDKGAPTLRSVLAAFCASFVY